MLIPSRLDDIIADSRARVLRLRREYPHREDFETHVRGALADVLAGMGYDPRVIKYTLRAIFQE